MGGRLAPYARRPRLRAVVESPLFPYLVPAGGPQSRPPAGVSALPGSSLESRPTKHEGRGEVAPTLNLFEFFPQGLETAAELRLEPPVGGRVEAALLEPIRHQLLVGDAPRFVVGVAVALAAPELRRSRVVRVAQVVGRGLGAVAANLGAG